MNANPAPSNASDLLCGERPGGKYRETHVIRLESADGSLRVQLRRTHVGAGAGESSLFRLDGFSLFSEGKPRCVTDAASLEYENTHHNWTDLARAESGGRRYELQMNFDGADTLAAFTADGSVTLEPTPLIATGAPPFCWECPAALRVAISEVMSRNVSTLADEAGEFEPWIELYNPSAEAIPLAGWTLSDDFARRDKWQLPAVTIPRGGTLVIHADGEVDEGELHASFMLSAEGGELVLTAPDGTTDGGIVLEPGADDESLTWDWNAAAYTASNTPTPGAPPTE